MDTSAHDSQSYGFSRATLVHAQSVSGVSPAIDHGERGVAALGGQKDEPEDKEDEDGANEDDNEESGSVPFQEEVHADTSVNPPLKMARDPGAPSREEVEAHYMCHLPYRAWCPVCVQAKKEKRMHTEERRAEELEQRFHKLLMSTHHSGSPSTRKISAPC